MVGSGGPGLSVEDPESVATAERLEGDIDKTLQSARFVIGDYISCAVFPPLVDGAVAPPLSALSASSAGGAAMSGGNFGRTYSSGGAGRPLGRENGYPPGGYGGSYGGGGGRSRGNGRFDGSSRNVPIGEWRRGERLPDSGPGGGYRGRGRGRNW